MKKMTHSFILVAAIILNFAAFGQKKADNKVLMQIGNEKVMVKEFMDVFTKNNVQNEVIDKKSLDEYLDLYINFRLKVMEAMALKLDTNQAFIRELDGYRKQLAKPYFTDSKVSDALLQEAYDRKLQDIRASHILLMLDKNAPPQDTLEVWNRIMKIRDRIMNGEDFAQVAIEASEDPSASDKEAIPNQRSFRAGNKGDLGYFSVFDMVYPFETGAYETEIGQVSMPLRSEFGYHLIKVTEKTPASGLIEAAHIYVSVNPESSKEEIAEKEEKIQFIYGKINEGMSFEDAVREYSEDRGSAARDGLLSKFAVNRIVPEFVSVVKKLQPGEISAPVQTVYGFHIIKLIGFDKPGSFEDEAPKLKERISKDVRSQKSEDAVIKQIKAENKFKTVDKNLKAFLSKLDSSLIKGNFNAEAFEMSKTELFRLGKKQYTEADFAKYLSLKQTPQENINPDVYAYKLYNDFVRESCLAYEDSRLEIKYPEFASLMREYRDGILLFDLMDQRVWSKAVKDTTGLKNFYEANKDNYMWKERADATVYTITSKDELSRVKNIIESLSDDKEIREALEKDSLRAVRIQPGKFELGDNKFVDATKWTLGLSDVMYAEADKFDVIVRIREILPAQTKALDESRGIITSDYQNYLEKEWINILRAKYPVNVDQKVYEQLKASY
jgi:peptidyl-prolyl cis-trans isomerase SurA